ncbi:MAG: hypothetical protein LH614_02750 [Pyrinomonadaceae bacterium]|nr:hypothetical protein [Pyrinomonadaceae bacterium]
MELRVWDNRKSECFAVMAKIRIETLSGVKTGRLRDWSFSTGKVIDSASEKNANDGSFGLAGALLTVKTGTDNKSVLLNQWL